MRGADALFGVRRGTVDQDVVVDSLRDHSDGSLRKQSQSVPIDPAEIEIQIAPVSLQTCVDALEEPMRAFEVGPVEYRGEERTRPSAGPAFGQDQRWPSSSPPRQVRP